MPDPIVTRASDLQPEEEALLADSVSLALLVVLDSLGPAERLAFVLHDMFGLPFEEIASMLDRTPGATRPARESRPAKSARRRDTRAGPRCCSPARGRRCLLLGGASGRFRRARGAPGSRSRAPGRFQSEASCRLSGHPWCCGRCGSSARRRSASCSPPAGTRQRRGGSGSHPQWTALRRDGLHRRGGQDRRHRRDRRSGTRRSDRRSGPRRAVAGRVFPSTERPRRGTSRAGRARRARSRRRDGGCASRCRRR